MHNRNHRITWREFGKRIDPHVSFSQRWARSGKWMKRQLSKARRQLDEEIIRYQLGLTDRVRERGFPSWSGEVNWKGW